MCMEYAKNECMKESVGKEKKVMFSIKSEVRLLVSVDKQQHLCRKYHFVSTRPLKYFPSIHSCEL